MKYDICQYETDIREKFAGHRSSHVRRGELQKRVHQVRIHECLICHKVFDSGPALGGHQKIHIISFDELKSNGSKRDRLIRDNGHHCDICNNHEWMGQLIPLTLDHIDGNTDNQARENLRVLCPNCHAQTPTYCGRNVGKFPLAMRTKNRAKYYTPVAQRT